MKIRALRSLFIVASLALCSMHGEIARADTPPSVWDRAKNPSALEAYRIHLAVEARLAETRRFDVGDGHLRTVRTVLERALAKNPDPLLRFDLGHVYLRLMQYEASAKTLSNALSEYPTHPAAEEGWRRLAFACGHTGDHECERRAYLQTLKDSTDEMSRALPTLNLAETEMHLGNLREAIEGYREAFRIASRLSGTEIATAPLAMWGLAVALDRSGDRAGAENAARSARELERSMHVPHLLRSEDVFFVPAYEVHWYEGLGASAQAKSPTTTPVEAVRLWRASEQSFAAYVEKATATSGDRWLELAKVRLATAKAERAKAEKRALAGFKALGGARRGDDEEALP